MNSTIHSKPFRFSAIADHVNHDGKPVRQILFYTLDSVKGTDFERFASHLKDLSNEGVVSVTFQTIDRGRVTLTVVDLEAES